MSLTGFNRARRAAAEQTGQAFDEVSYEQATEILSQPDLVLDLVLGEALDDEGEPTIPLLSRETRIEQLKAGTWEDLKNLLKGYGLPTDKTKGMTWNEYAIPQILKHEGFE